MTKFNRGTGLLIIYVQNSNPNGDPDAESDPRTFDDGRGLISPVSFKRKVRDVIEEKNGPVWQSAQAKLHLSSNGERRYNILETRDRDFKQITGMKADSFVAEFWDGRIFGNTTLESKAKDKHHLIRTGVVQFGPGVSISPINVVRSTLTKKAGAEADKDRGMAPLAWRFVERGLYTMPFFVNPSVAGKTGCDEQDIELLKFAIPHAYACTASAGRPSVSVVHAWYAEHQTPLGSCADPAILNALTPKRTEGDPEEPCKSFDDYEIPTSLPDNIRNRLASFEDLCAKAW